MTRNITVSVRSLLLAGLVLMGMVTAYLVGSSGDGVTAPAQAAQQEAPAPGDQRLVAMVGEGEATAVPDRMSFALSVSSKRLQLGEALASSSRTMRRVLGVLGQHGVEDADVQTTGLSMYPEYDYHSYGPPTLTGYRVTQRAKVGIDRLGQGGRAVAAAIETGGNGVRVRDIRLEVGDPEAVLGEARDAAVEAATAKAEQYAAATGQELGEVVSIREVGAGRTAPGRELAGLAYQSADMARAALPVRAGKDDLRVRIEVVWAFQ